MTKLSQALLPYLDNKSHVIWDFNGTLLNDIDHTVGVVNTLLTEHNLKNISNEDYRQIFSFPVLDYYIRLGFDFQKESFESLCDKFIQRFMSGFKESCVLMPEIEQTLALVKTKTQKQSILSAAEQQGLLEIVNHHQIERHFDHIYGIGNHYADSKVARGHELLKAAGHASEQTLIIGDTIHDLEVGRALGIDVILVGHGHQCATRLRQHHDKVLEIH